MKKLLITLIIVINCVAQESQTKEISSSIDPEQKFEPLKFTPTYEESDMKILDFANIRYTAALKSASKYQKETNSNIEKMETTRNTLGIIAATRILGHYIFEDSSKSLPLITFWGAGSICLGLTGLKYFYKKHAQEKIKKDLDPSKIDFQDFTENIKKDYSEDCQLVKNIKEMERLRSW